ncbi:hypothetical protein BD626DRAFT_533192 [Schizophyllum amplum]|uniref:Uncharacterized protein n=1 Tax=Schizophyllum amplum TaxID=97359 RepID=A0A550CXT2_9AGAR|nr:hypothetical protein BD626DRAFT_533192 [Auriculariopsis ampla]
MSSISSLETITADVHDHHQTTPKRPAQVPASPAEEDLARPHVWKDDEPELDAPRYSSRRKGKERSPSTDDNDDDDDDGDRSDAGSYPPVNDEEAETRRVEETLRRWELAERERRRCARESTKGSGDAPSLVGSVARRASLLFSPGQHRTPPRPQMGGPLGNHRALQSRDSLDMAGVQLDDIATPTPSPTFADHRRKLSLPENDPFADPAQTGAVMEPLAEVPDHPNSTGPTPDGPVLLARRESTLRHPPLPKPLNLPQPRSPPPIHSPPLPMPPPTASSQSSDAEDYEPPTRWWHEWLCGCGEGPDRGGDRQAGRTNPYE